jgi:hypothetical protein
MAAIAQVPPKPAILKPTPLPTFHPASGQREIGQFSIVLALQRRARLILSHAGNYVSSNQ